MHPRRWSSAEFDSMSWHDCHVHAFRIAETEHGTGELELDIDYILEWRTEKDKFSFLLVPATLTFHKVFGLRVALDWATPTAGMGPFSLSAVEKSVEDRGHCMATLWHLPLNWPDGSLKFEAEGFTQVAWGREVISSNQVLTQGQRVAA
jgi:hypothetical protein